MFLGNDVYKICSDAGVDVASEAAKEMAAAYNSILDQAAKDKLVALDLISERAEQNYKGTLAEVAAHHGRMLSDYPEPFTPDSRVYLLKGGTNGKRPDYVVIEGDCRIMAHGTFFGRESSFGFYSKPDITALVRIEELSRIKYRAKQAALEVAKAPPTDTRIVNMTPHPINILDADNNEIARYESAGQIRLASHTEQAEKIAGIPTSRTIFGTPEGLPDFVSGTFYIVSQLVKSALPGRTDLLVPAEVVRDSSGNIIGCRSLGR